MTLTVGKPAPSFTLPSSDGGTFALDDLRGTSVVVYFYPRDNTPGCTIEAQEFRDAVPALTKLGARVVGISKDSIASHCKVRDKFSLSFPLLSDPDGKVLEAYGAWGEKMMYGKPMTGIIRSTVLVDAGGKVAKVWPKVSVKGHVAAVLEAVAALGGGGGSKATPTAKPAKAAAAPAPKSPKAKAIPKAKTAPKAAKPKAKAKPATKAKPKKR